VCVLHSISISEYIYFNAICVCVYDHFNINWHNLSIFIAINTFIQQINPCVDILFDDEITLNTFLCIFVYGLYDRMGETKF